MNDSEVLEALLINFYVDSGEFEEANWSWIEGHSLHDIDPELNREVVKRIYRNEYSS